jgi:hypothetical protein
MNRRILALFAAIAALASCKAKTDAFYADTFTCDPNVANTCGTTKSGQPMVCYSAQSLGGTGFCTEVCDPNDATMARSGVVCATMTLSAADGGVSKSGGLLTECAPSMPDGCPERLTCYRTGLTEDKGVCLAMPVCAESKDCPANRSTCGADVIRGAVPPALTSMLATNHLHCLAVGCKNGGMQCQPGEGCVGAYLNFGPPIDELCVPGCDLNKACPPNFTCLRDANWAPGASPLCFPGMLGTRCAEADDCLMGECTDVGVEFKVCTIPCTSTAQCAALNTPSDVYYCANGHCLTPRPFQGSNCGKDTDCIASQRCVGGTITGDMMHGECRTPCDADGKCPARGGLPHICLGADRKGLCYPSNFATPCETQDDCLASFKCMPAAPDVVHSPQTGYATHICTITCTTDADCDADSFTKKNGFCQDGICRLAGGEGVPCKRKEECVSDRCETPSGKTATECVSPLTVMEPPRQ